MHRRFFTSLGLFSVATAIAIPDHNGVPIDTRNISEIYAAAQRERGILQVAWGGDERSQSGSIAQAFAEAFPNVTANFTTDLSKYHDGRINHALANGQVYADVAVLQTLHDYDQWKNEGHLLNYKPGVYGKLWSAFTDIAGAYLPVAALSFGPFVFNTSIVPPSSAPTSYADILAPEWKDKLVLTYPNDDDAVLFLFTRIVTEHGWEWLEALEKQNVQWVRGTATPVEILAGYGGPTNRTLSFTTFALGPDFAYIEPTTDHYMSWTQTSAIFKNTQMPETAKLLQSFLVSNAWQDQYLKQGSPSVRKDLGHGNATIWGVENTDFVSFHRFMEKRDMVEAWRFAIEDVIGTAQGLSPLIDNIGQ